MKQKKAIMFVMRITMVAAMSLALLGALHFTTQTARAAGTHLASDSFEATENIEEQEGQNNDVNESIEDVNDIVPQEELQGQDTVIESNDDVDTEIENDVDTEIGDDGDTDIEDAQGQDGQDQSSDTSQAEQEDSD